MSDLSERLRALTPGQRRDFEERLSKLEAERGAQASLAQQEHEGPFRASFAQVRLWLLDQLYEQSALYNEPYTARLTGALDVAALRHSMAQIIERHEALRTTFTAENEIPYQIIQPARPFDLPLIDLRHLAVDEREAEWRQSARRLVHQPFDLERDLMMRGQIYRLADAEHIMLLVRHHIAGDLTSRRIFEQELTALYNAEVANSPSALPALPLQYKEYAIWQYAESEKPAHADQLAYWEKQLAGIRASELPTDRPRPVQLSYAGASVHFELAAPLVRKLKALAQSEGATMYMLLLAAFNALLQRYTGQDDIVVGSPVANRDIAEFDRLIGLFINTVVMRSDLSGNPSFRDLLRRVRNSALDAIDHRAAPFEQVIAVLDPERQLNRNPLFQVMFQVINNVDSPPRLHNIEVERFPIEYGIAKFDCEVNLRQEGDKYAGRWRYASDLFDVETIQRMVAHYLRLLEAVADDPERTLDQLEMLTAAERRQLLVGWNLTQASFDTDKTLSQLVTDQARRTPWKTAATFAEESWSYAELEERAEQLAHKLRQQGVTPQTLVGLCVERSLDMMAALLGIMKAGGAFVPLDPHYPAERIKMMLADARPALIVTQQQLAGRLAESDLPLLVLDGGEMPETAGKPSAVAADQLDAAGPDNLAYVIYTSGSTGKPKGVQITHRAIVNFLMAGWQPEILSADDRLLAVSSLSFDISLFDLFLPLLHGAQVVIASREAARDGARLQQLLVEQDITILQATPATFRLLLLGEWAGKENLTILSGGEALPPHLVEQLLPRCRALWNLYGPTETTVYSTRCQIISAAEPITVGRPLANTQIYILDDRLRLLPVGAVGQLYIAGEGLARGYLNKPEMSAERFLPNPFEIEEHGPLIYRTGDLARYLPDGRIVILGRDDFQVKLRGFRIELGEIETAVAHHPAVAQNITAMLEGSEGDKRLITYWIPQANQTALPTEDELRAGLRTILPDPMIPSRFVMLDAFPLTPGGKIDRQALPEPAEEAAHAEEHLAPHSFVEMAVASIWSDVLQRTSIGKEDDFFAIGGHSLLAMQVITRIRRQFGIILPLRVIFDFPTLEGLAGQLLAALDELPPG